MNKEFTTTSLINTFKISFKVNYTYSINLFIYILKKIPIIGPMIPAILYKSEKAKNVINIISFIILSVYELIKKALYFWLAIYLPATLLNKDITNLENFTGIVITIFTFLTITGGGLLNNVIVKATNSKFYNVILMHVDAKEYEISNFIYYLLKHFIYFIGCLIVLTINLGISINYVFLFTLFSITIKIIFNALNIFIYNKKKIILTQKVWYYYVGGLIGIALAYGLPALGITIPIYVFNIVLLASIGFAILGLIYILKNNTYKTMAKEIVTVNKILFNSEEEVKKAKKDQVKMDEGTIDLNDKIYTKKGYDFFNKVFFRRHRRILLKSAKMMALIALALFSYLIIMVIIKPENKENVNQLIMTQMPYLLFIMYFINRGSIITQAMFFNCDSSMLTYKFYKDSKVILNVFKQRLKTVALVNSLPAIVIAILLPALLYISGGAENVLTYPAIFLSIMFMSFFFSVHHLTIYYLFQPYDIGLNSKGPIYGIISILTYLGCYTIMQQQIPVNTFALVTIIATFGYILSAIFLVYRFAPRTFKMRQ